MILHISLLQIHVDSLLRVQHTTTLGDVVVFEPDGTHHNASLAGLYIGTVGYYLWKPATMPSLLYSIVVVGADEVRVRAGTHRTVDGHHKANPVTKSYLDS
jgi:hypothetical protein